MILTFGQKVPFRFTVFVENHYVSEGLPHPSLEGKGRKGAMFLTMFPAMFFAASEPRQKRVGRCAEDLQADHKDNPVGGYACRFREYFSVFLAPTQSRFK